MGHDTRFSLGASLMSNVCEFICQQVQQLLLLLHSTINALLLHNSSESVLCRKSQQGEWVVDIKRMGRGEGEGGTRGRAQHRGENLPSKNTGKQNGGYRSSTGGGIGAQGITSCSNPQTHAFGQLGNGHLVEVLEDPQALETPVQLDERDIQFISFTMAAIELQLFHQRR